MNKYDMAEPIKVKEPDNDFWVECNVCKTQYKNWIGSTPCCGSIAWIIEDGKPTKKLSLFASVGGEPIAPIVFNMETDEKAD